MLKLCCTHLINSKAVKAVPFLLRRGSYWSQWSLRRVVSSARKRECRMIWENVVWFKKMTENVETAGHPWGITYQFLLLHALHKDDEQMLSLGSSVCESLLYSHQQLVPQRFIYQSANKNNVKSRSTNSYSAHISEKYKAQEGIMRVTLDRSCFCIFLTKGILPVIIKKARHLKINQFYYLRT